MCGESSRSTPSSKISGLPSEARISVARVITSGVRARASSPLKSTEIGIALARTFRRADGVAAGRRERDRVALGRHAQQPTADAHEVLGIGRALKPSPPSKALTKATLRHTAAEELDRRDGMAVMTSRCRTHRVQRARTIAGTSCNW